MTWRCEHGTDRDRGQCEICDAAAIQQERDEEHAREVADLRHELEEARKPVVYKDASGVMHSGLSSLPPTPEQIAEYVGGIIKRGDVDSEVRFLRALAEHVRDERAKDALAAAGSP